MEIFKTKGTKNTKGLLNEFSKGKEEHKDH